MKRQKSIFDQIPNQFFFFGSPNILQNKILQKSFFTCWSLQTHNVSFTYGIKNVVLISL